MIPSYWFNERVTRRMWHLPRWEWWWQPSGGKSAPPRPWKWYDYLESPLWAHVGGGISGVALSYAALLAAGASIGLRVLIVACLFSFAFSMTWQLSKAGMGFPDPVRLYSWREVIWRMALVVVGIAVAAVAATGFGLA